LSGETAVGDDPAGAVRAMARICRGAEADVNLPNLFADANPATARILVALRGVLPTVVDRPPRIEDAIPLALDAVRAARYVSAGQRVVVCASRTSPRSDADTLWLHSEP